MEQIDFYWFVLYAALNGIMLVILGLNVSRQRIVLKIPHGDGGHKEMIKAIRTHANAVEHGVLFGVLVLAMTLAGASETMLGVMVVAFIISRIVHPIGMLSRRFQFRRIGAGVTFLLQGIACVYLLMNLA